MEIYNAKGHSPKLSSWTARLYSKTETIIIKLLTILLSTSFGLGLFISKKIMDEHGGNIWNEDNNPNGTIFFLEFMPYD